MACDPVLGEELHDETVTDQTILGGTTMTAYRARYDRLGSGDRPGVDVEAPLIDELDVADLESEAEHAYRIGAARDTDDRVLEHEVLGRAVADGARMKRTADHFVLRGRASKPSVMVARLTAEVPTDVEVRIGDRTIGTAFVSSGWTEVRWALPESLGAERMVVSVSAVGSGRFGSAHYWLYADESR
jgi:hypothetical protein